MGIELNNQQSWEAMRPGETHSACKVQSQEQTSLVSGSPTGHSEASGQVMQAWEHCQYSTSPTVVPCTVTPRTLPYAH